MAAQEEGLRTHAFVGHSDTVHPAYAGWVPTNVRYRVRESPRHQEMAGTFMTGSLGLAIWQIPREACTIGRLPGEE